MSRRNKRKTINEPPKLWFHGESELDRVLMGVVPERLLPSRSAVATAKPDNNATPFQPTLYALVAQYSRQTCTRCCTTQVWFDGLFSKTTTTDGSTYSPITGDITKAAPELAPAQPISACYACLSGVQHV
jgi:hypothetical protein